MHNEMLEAGVSPKLLQLIPRSTASAKTEEHQKHSKIFFLHAKASTSGTSSNLWSPDHMTYTALIQGFCQEGQIFKATKLFSDMRFHGLQQDEFTYVAMLKGHFQAKHIIDVMMLHADVIKKGVVQNARIYQMLARCYRQSGYLKSVFNLSED